MSLLGRITATFRTAFEGLIETTRAAAVGLADLVRPGAVVSARDYADAQAEADRFLADLQADKAQWHASVQAQTSPPLPPPYGQPAYPNQAPATLQTPIPIPPPSPITTPPGWARFRTQECFVADGLTLAWTLQSPIIGPIPPVTGQPGAVGYAVVWVDGVAESLGHGMPGLHPLDWEYNPATRVVWRRGGPPKKGAQIVIDYESHAPFTYQPSPSAAGFPSGPWPITGSRPLPKTRPSPDEDPHPCDFPEVIDSELSKS